MFWVASAVVLLSGALAVNSQSRSSKIQVVIESHHNDNGTWQTQVKYKTEAFASEYQKNPPWNIGLDQETRQNFDGQSTLMTIISLEAPDLQGCPTKAPIMRSLNPEKTCEATTSTLEVTLATTSTPEATLATTSTPEVTLATTSTPEVTMPTTQAPKCQDQKVPDGYDLHPGVGFYKFRQDVANWATARDRCAQEGGHLVIINSEAERAVIKKLFAEQTPLTKGSSYNEEVHTGIMRTSDGKHTTIFGVPLEETGFKEWYPGEPNGGANEPCVALLGKDIQLNDISCESKIRAFICEIEIKPNSCQALYVN